MTVTGDPHSAAQWGSATDWAMMITVVLAAVILVGLVASRVIYRGAGTEGAALWLHLLTLGIFPVFLLVIGNFAAFEYVREERFCGTCHITMKVYIDDLRDPKGTSLAALHFQHRFMPGTGCYACHADYGLAGGIEAKKTGLRHVYKYVTGTYQLPLMMHKPYANSLCLKCHEGAKRFMAEELHLDGNRVSAELRRGETRCGECHKPAHRIPVRAERRGGAG